MPHAQNSQTFSTAEVLLERVMVGKARKDPKATRSGTLLLLREEASATQVTLLSYLFSPQQSHMKTEVWSPLELVVL